MRRRILPRPVQRVYLGRGAGIKCLFDRSVLDNIKAALSTIETGGTLAGVSAESPSGDPPWVTRGFRVRETLEDLVTLVHKRVGQSSPESIRSVIVRFTDCGQPWSRSWSIGRPFAHASMASFVDASGVAEFVDFFVWVERLRGTGVAVTSILGWLDLCRGAASVSDEIRSIQMELDLRGREMKSDEREDLEGRLKQRCGDLRSLEAEAAETLPEAAGRLMREASGGDRALPFTGGDVLGPLFLIHSPRTTIRVERGSPRQEKGRRRRLR